MSAVQEKQQKPMSEDEAGKEMKKMVAFIMQEAAEKTREIQVKADEEFNIEKAKIVRHETAAIEQLFERKLKQADVKRRIAQSVQINKSRLQVLQARDQVLEEVAEETKKHLCDISNNESVYSKLLQDLILQSLYRLMEDKVIISCRNQDIQIIEKGISHTVTVFAKESGIRASVSIDTVNHLSAEGAGGIIATGLAGRIRCDNTLETRMEQAVEAMLPTIRVRLFGNSPNRKFFD